MFKKKIAVSGAGMILAAALAMAGCSSQGTSPAPAQTQAAEEGAAEDEEKARGNDNRDNTADTVRDGRAVKESILITEFPMPRQTSVSQRPTRQNPGTA